MTLKARHLVPAVDVCLTFLQVLNSNTLIPEPSGVHLRQQYGISVEALLGQQLKFMVPVGMASTNANIYCTVSASEVHQHAVVVCRQVALSLCVVQITGICTVKHVGLAAVMSVKHITAP